MFSSDVINKINIEVMSLAMTHDIYFCLLDLHVFLVYYKQLFLECTVFFVRKKNDKIFYGHSTGLS